jgi:nitrous oxide reductase accessory protein NosL
MKRRVVLLLAVLLLLGVDSPRGGEPNLPPQPGPKERCPVCGMFAAKYPSWLAAAVFRDGSVTYFDGPKDMFRYYFAMDRFGKTREPSDIEALFVTDYYSTRMIAAKQAFFVRGSDVPGPMGQELVPLKSREEAQTFSTDHKAVEVLSFESITPDVLSKLK